jgi:hypothetical protein
VLLTRRYSRERVDELTRNAAIGFVLLLALGTVWALGPGLEAVLANARRNPHEHYAPRYYVAAARIMDLTFREERAEEVREEFYLLWCGRDSLETMDFSQVTKGDGDQWYYLPWVEARFTEENRPRAVTANAHNLLGDVLVSLAYTYERRRDYYRSEHVWACLRTFWPPGSIPHREGQQALRRSLQRSF